MKQVPYLANAVLAALVELTALAAFSLFGWSLASSLPLRVLISFACAGAISLAWSRWAAPKAPRRLAGAPLAAFKLAVFGGGAAAILTLDHPAIAGTFAAIALFQIALAASIRSL